MEAVQAARMVPYLTADMLLLADRNYSGFLLWEQAVRTGAALLWRVKANRKLPVLEALADGSYRSSIRAGGKPRKRLPVRVIEYRLKEEAETYRLITALMDPAQAPAAELVGLYRQRWKMETAYAEIKSTLLADAATLRSKTPQ